MKSENQSLRFVGHRAQLEMHQACNDKSWFATSKNKLLWQTLMIGGGFRVPQTLAIYDQKGRGAGVVLLTNEPALADFLSNPANIPLFCKPVTGTYSIGAFRIDGFEGGIALINGQWRKSVSEIAEYFTAIGKKGYLLQRPLKPHNNLRQYTGDAIATLRFLLRMDGGAPVIMRAVVKLPPKGEVADNFWRRDAQLCSIDEKTGKVVAIITNNPTTKGHDSGALEDDQMPVGFQLPDFQIATELVSAAARHFPAIRTQSWDVAMSEEGPVLMELNFGGDLSLVQLAHDKGMLDKEYCTHLRRCEYRGKLPIGD